MEKEERKKRKKNFKLSDKKIEQIRHLRREGSKQIEIANLLNVSQWSVSKILNEKKLISVELYNKLIKIKIKR